jgi:alkylhydroperoxidase family enzyme
VGRELGVTGEQLRDLPSYRESSAFSDEERLVIELAVEMSKTPVELPPELLDELHRCFDEAQLVELSAAVAWENYRARFNRVFGVQAAGFSVEAAFCALPERPVRLHGSG